MIRVGIAGGTNPVAGDLIRMLINHPDVELMWVCDPIAEGTPVTSVHRGLYGETYLRFVEHPDWQSIDLVYLCFDDCGSTAFIETEQMPDDISVIDLSADHRIPARGVWEDPDLAMPDADEWVYGLPEFARKPMVRGAKRAAVPTPLAHAVLLALLPLAKNNLLDQDIEVSAVVAAVDSDPGETLTLLDCDQIDEVKATIRTLQPNFSHRIFITAVTGGWSCGITVNIHLPMSAPENRLREIYDEFYIDHNFTFMSDRIPALNDVTGTNKCLIHIDKVSEQLCVTVVMDDTLKGSAGTAVHDMNLIFGLQERVGLMLKAIGD